MGRRLSRLLSFVAVLGASLAVVADEPIDLGRALRQAEEPLRARDWSGAVRSLRGFREKNPGTEEAKEAWVLEARALLLAKAPEEALAATSAFLKAHGEDEWAGRMMHTAADAYAALGRGKDRTDALVPRVDATTAPQARAKIGALHLALADEDFDGKETTDDLGRKTKVKNVARALASYRQALDVGVPEDQKIRVRERIASALEETGQHAEAAAAWGGLLKDLWAKVLVAKAEQEVTWLVGKGRASLAAGNRDEARKALKTALDRAPTGSPRLETLLLLGEERLSAAGGGAGDDVFEEGVTWLRRAILEHRDDPKAADAQIRLARAYEQKGQSEKAAAEYGAFADRFPQDERAPEARDRRAEALVRAGRFDDAVAEWERFLASYPNHPAWTGVREKIVAAQFVRGEALKQQGDLDAAVAAWKAFAEKNPEDGRAPQALLLAGQVLRERKDAEAALGLWRQVGGRYADTPQAPAARLAIGLTLEDDLGRLEEAVKAYEEVIQKHGGSGEAGEAKARLDRLKAKHLDLRGERVVGTAEKPVLKVATRNVQALKVRVYKLELEEYFRRKGTLDGIENLQLEIVKPDVSSDWKVEDYKPFALIQVERPVPVSGAGAYVVVAGDDDLTATVLLLVSDVEAVVKTSRGRQVFVWAFDRATTQPVEGARVLAAGGERIEELGKTGKDGVFVAERGAPVTNVLVLAPKGAASTSIQPGNVSEAGFQSKAYVYAAQPVYRPGQTVDWRAMFLLANGGAYRAPGERTGKVTIHDARGQVLLAQETTCTAFGTFSGSFPLDATAPLGRYRIHLEVENVGSWDGEVEVQEFRKPEFTVAVEPARRTYLTGEKVEAKVRLRYTFGGPVAGAPVQWEVARLPRTFEISAADDYSWYFKDDAPKPQERTTGGTIVARGTSAADDAGDLAISFETAEKDEDAEYVVRAAAMDVTRRWIGDEARIPVTQREYLALVRTDLKVAKPKQEIRAEVRTVDAVERALSRSGSLVLLKVKRSPVPTPRGGPVLERDRAGIVVRDEETEVASYPVTTDAKGTAEVRLSLPQPGRWRLRWRATDARGGLVTAYADVEAAGEAEDLTKDARIVAARTLWREGETAEAMIQSPVTNVTCLFTHEGEKVLAWRFLPLTSGSTLVEVPVLGEYAPNVFWKVAIPGKGRLLEAETGIVVLRQLDVSVAFSKPVALPGEEVEVTVATTDVQGRPVKSEVGLSVVDEALYAIAPDRAPPIRPYFYDKRRVNVVVTGSSLAFQTYGTTRETSKDLLADEAARSGDAQQVFARSALRLAREALQAGDVPSAVAQAMQAAEADPSSWDVRAFLGELRARPEARQAFALLAAQEEAKSMSDELRRAAESQAAAPRRKAAPRPGFRQPSDPTAPPPPAAAPAPAPEMMDRLADKDAERYEEAEDARDEKGLIAGDMPADGGVTVGTGGGAGGGYAGRGGGSRSLKARGGGGRAADRLAVLEAESADLRQLQMNKENLFKSVVADASLKEQAAAWGGIAEVELELRKTFADQAAWQPRLVTGEDGKAKTTVKLPDNLTTWRAVVRGTSGSALVGDGRASVMATRDLIVRVDPPRFLTQSDRVTVPVAVHNESGKDLDVKVGLTAEGVDLAGSDSTVPMKDGARAVVDRVANAVNPGGVRFEATATADGGGDRAEVRLSTLPRGLKTFDGRSGTVATEKGPTQETFVDVPAGAIPGATRLAVVLYPGLDECLLDALLYLDLYPYGCVEQTVHRFLPALEARAALQAAGSPAGKRLAQLDDAIRQAAVRLRNLQNDDGSFGWFRRGGGNLEMTAYALLGLAGAREAGVPDLDRAIGGAAQAIRRLMPSGDEDGRALAHRALATVGVLETEAYATTFRRRSDDLSVAGLAWLALAANDLGRSYDAEELVRLLVSRRVEKDTHTYWKGKAEDCFVGSDREATGLAARALLETQTATPHVDRALAWLLASRTGANLGTTKDVAAFVGAVAAYVRVNRVQGFGGTIDVLLDGKTVRTVKVGPGEMRVEDRRFLVPEAKDLAPGRHAVAFRLAGEGRVDWAVRLETVVASEELPGETHGLTLERRYLKPEEAPVEGQPAPVKPGYEILRPAARPKVEPEDLKAVESGDRVLVRIEVNAPRDLEYVLLEDPLPAGFEVLQGTAGGTYDWQERRDDRQVFFVSKLAKGPQVLTYVIQATHLGEFTALGTTAYGMYAPEVHGRAAGKRLAIRSAGSGGTGAEQPPTPDELYDRAKKLHAERAWDQALPILVSLVTEQPLRDEIVEEIEAMRLQIAVETKDDKGIVRAREELVKRNPKRIPGDLDTARSIAFAYRAIGEQEVAAGLFLDLVARGFDLRVGYGRTLAERGREIDGLDALGRDLRSFPVTNGTAALAFQRAQRYRELPRPEGRKGPKGKPMDDETLDALWSLTAHYAELPVAAPATYALIDAQRRAGDVNGAASTAEAFLGRYPDSPFLDDARYFFADSRFRKFEAGPTPEAGAGVVEAAKPLTDQAFPMRDGRKGPSEFRSRAYHLMARVDHVLGRLESAIRNYREAPDVEDAREALAFLTEQRLELEETVTVAVEGGASFPIRYRNVKEVVLKAYPVDLQVLFAIRKTLVGLTKIDLSGILPAKQWTLPLPGAEDHGPHEAKADLPVEAGKPGAWLVIAKSGDLEAGTLVLKSDLKVVLQRVGEKLRVYATDAEGKAVRGAYVTVADGQRIRARGVTDGRGLFEAPGVGAAASVVVSLGDRYGVAR